MGFSSIPGALGVSPPERADALRDRLHHPPDAFGFTHSRWRLVDLRQVVPELATAQPETVRLFYVDETHIQRAPTLAPRYAPRGREPVTRLAPGNDLRQRYAGALDLVRGELTWLSAMRVGTEHVCRLLRKLRRRYPTQRLIVVWDNWQTHLSEAVLFCAAAEAIELLWLPTYAPWTNPIEKLWRWLRQDVLHQHRWAADWTTLLAQVAAFFDRFTDGSPALLRYVGLLPD